MTLGPRGWDFSRWIGLLIRVWTRSGCLIDCTHIRLGGGFVASLAVCFLGGDPSFTLHYFAIFHGILYPCATIVQLLKVHHDVYLVLFPRTIDHFGGLIPPSYQIFKKRFSFLLFSGL